MALFLLSEVLVRIINNLNFKKMNAFLTQKVNLHSRAFSHVYCSLWGGVKVL